MSARPLALILLLAVVAPLAGWAIASALDGRSAVPPSPPPPPPVVELAVTDPAADLAEALPVDEMPPPSASPPPVAVATVPDWPRTAIRPRRPPAPAPLSQPQPEPQPAPIPAPEPPPAEPAPEPESAPVPDPDPIAPAAAPPPPDERAPRRTLSIPPAEEVADADRAQAILEGVLADGGADELTRAAVGRQLELWHRYGDPAGPSTPDGRRQTQARALRVNAWWYGRNGHPDGQVVLRDPEGLLYTARHGHGFIVNPVATTGRWHDLNADVAVVELAEALLPLGIPRRVDGRTLLVWEYYDIVGDPTAIRPGISGMAQGRLALMMANAFRISGDGRFLEASRRAMNALATAVGAGGARSLVRMGPAQDPAPWYVERANPGDPPWTGGALNGFMVTLLNLRGVGTALDRAAAAWPDTAPDEARAGAELARRLADAGLATLVRHLPDHDTGTWSYYGLLTGGRPWRTHVADLNYHCYHIRLLERLAAIHPDRGLDGWIGRWSGYVDRAGLTCPPGAAASRRAG